MCLDIEHKVKTQLKTKTKKLKMKGSVEICLDLAVVYILTQGQDKILRRPKLAGVEASGGLENSFSRNTKLRAY